MFFAKLYHIMQQYRYTHSSPMMQTKATRGETLPMPDSCQRACSCQRVDQNGRHKDAQKETLQLRKMQPFLANKVRWERLKRVWRWFAIWRGVGEAFVPGEKPAGESTLRCCVCFSARLVRQPKKSASDVGSMWEALSGNASVLGWFG